MAAVLRGKELGFPPMSSLSSLHVVQGKVGLNYDAIVGLLSMNGYKVFWADSEDANKSATVTIEKGGEKLITVTYTIEDARRAELLGSSAWKKHPASMMRARAVSNAARAVAGDIFCGCYSQDELEEIRGSQQPQSLKTVKSGKEAARLALGNVTSSDERDDDIVIEDKVEDEVDVGDLMIKLGRCRDMDELNSLAKEIKLISLDSGSAEDLGGAYSIRKEELQKC